MRQEIIVEMKFGSHLYGTNTPQSDLDIKGIYLPTFEDVVLGKVKKSITENTKSDNSKNSKDDVDKEYYSLHYFLKLACQGQTVALDMLHAPPEMIIQKSVIWNQIVKKKELFYTRNLKAFVGYARNQASKYGIKRSRLDSAKKILDILISYPINTKLKELWSVLPTTEHSFHTGKNKNGLLQYSICGKTIQETMKVEYAYAIIKNYHDEYGKRAELARDNKGVDFKAVSHAIRSALQVKELLLDGTITFPLKDAKYIKAIKNGELHYADVVAPRLEQLMDEVSELSEKSSYPDKADTLFWDNFIVKIYRNRNRRD
jgi:predicted nucleotidyltransferase